MAGKTLDEARTAQRNARRGGRNGGGSSQQASAAAANVATSTTTLSDGVITINGQTFLLTPAPSTSPAPSISASANTAPAWSDSTACEDIMSSGDLFEYHAYVALASI
jgi:hypothetical protein